MKLAPAMNMIYATIELIFPTHWATGQLDKAREWTDGRMDDKEIAIIYYFICWRRRSLPAMYQISPNVEWSFLWCSADGSAHIWWQFTIVSTCRKIPRI